MRIREKPSFLLALPSSFFFFFPHFLTYFSSISTVYFPLGKSCGWWSLEGTTRAFLAARRGVSSQGGEPLESLRRCPEVPDEDSVPLWAGLLGSPGKMFARLVNQDQNKLAGHLRGLQTGVGKGFAN